MDEDFCLPGSGAAAGRVSAVGTDGMVMAEGRILVEGECRIGFGKPC